MTGLSYDPLGDGLSNLESDLKRVLLIAYERGYRVTPDGRLLNHAGRRLAVRRYGTQQYPTVTIYAPQLGKRRKTYALPVHRLAAYCFYGETVFHPGLVTRHRDGDTLHICRTNILIGTPSQNNLDKPIRVRRAVAQIALASRPRRPVNAKLTADQVRQIREELAAGAVGCRLARDYGVHPTAITNIKRGRFYADC